MTELLTTAELAKRWKMTEDAIRKQRIFGRGPSYIKLGDSDKSHVRYKIEDIEAFEAQNEIKLEGETQ